MHASKCLTRGRKRIGSTWSRITCLNLALAAQNIILVFKFLKVVEISVASNDSDWKQVMPIKINKIVYQTVPKV
jgi:hypothetical protein